MNRRWSILIIAGLVAILSCEKDSDLLPPISVGISPSSGNTTSIYTFDLSKTLEHFDNDRIFVRFDWEGDSLFDTPFLNEKVLTHRYYAPGTYFPKAEIKNLQGQSCDSSFQIEVLRGYSNPMPAFTIKPERGHIHTVFTLDANITKDDEDSLSTLLFKWDFEGDGIWDTDLEKTLVIDHIYPEPKVYFPRLYVEDPGKRGNFTEQRLAVTLIDTCLKPDFATTPELFIQNEDIIFNAGMSYNDCLSDDKFMYRWDFNNDGYFDTEWSDDPTVIHSYPIEKYYTVKLEIRNSRSLENSTSKKFWIYHQNQAPRAKFSVSTYGGNTNTSFRFDSWGCRDLEDSPTQMLTRWDWNNDGTWDSEPNYEKVVFHTFNSPGNYTVAMELEDRGGLKDTAYQVFYINESMYETDILLDKRGNSSNYYGTIKIGNQWWFSKNLKVDNERLYQNKPYYSPDVDIRFYGYFYPYNRLRVVCPDGWRVPSRDDWDELFDNLPSDDYYDQLILGGKSGFNAVLGGFNSGPHFAKKGYYWTTTKPRDQHFTSVFVITFDKPNQQVLQGYHPEADNYSVRCMKDE